MKRAFLCRTALLVLMAGVLLTGKAEAQEPTTPCQTAYIPRQAGHYEEARDKYVELIRSDPSLACARDGLRSLPGEQAAQLYELGQAYEESSRPDLARDTYVAALRVDPAFDHAWQALEKLGPLQTEDQEPPSSCELAEAPHSKGFYQEARDAYFQLIKSNPELECARDGIKSLSREQAIQLVDELAQQYQGNKEWDLARDAYIEALKVDPTFDDAWQALESLQADDGTQDPLKVVEALARHGFGEEAKTRFQEAITNDPDLQVSSDLENQVVWEYSPWERLVDSLKPVWRPAIMPIAAAIIVLWLGLLFWPRLWPWSWIANRLFPQCLDIADFDDKAANLPIGPGLAARAEEELAQIATPEFQRRVHVIEGSAEALQIPGGVKSAAPSPFKFVLELIETVSPRPVITLQGRLQNSEDHGAGLTLTLVQKGSGKIMANQTIWQDAYDPEPAPSSTSQVPGTRTSSQPEKTATLPPAGPTADAYYLLAQLGASWTLFELDDKRPQKKRAKQHRDQTPWPSRLIKSLTATSGAMISLSPPESGPDEACEALVESLGTGRWRSYAFVQAGVYWRLRGERDKARRMFVMALDEDPHNRVALFNLGTLNTELGEYEEAREQLEKARKLLVGVPEKQEKRYRQDPMWYQATYYLASAYAYRAKTDANNRNSNIECAAAEAWALVKAIGDMLGENWPDKLQDSKGVNCSKLRKHWEHSEAVNKRLKEDRREEAADQGQETPRETSNEGSESKVQEPLRRYLEWLKPMALFLWLGIGIQERRITDIEQALGCVGYKVEDVSELHYRARYNLACCYSALGETLDARKKRKEAYEKSREHLNHALERGGDIVQWAQKDPSLRGVQEFERRQKAKKKCVTGIKDTIARIWK